MDSERKVNSDPRRSLPSVDRLIGFVKEKAPDLAEWAIVRAAREELELVRALISQGESEFEGGQGRVISLG